MLTLSPATQVTYCDLPLNLLFAARYLSLVLFPGQVHLAWDDTPIPASARITLVPPWRPAEEIPLSAYPFRSAYRTLSSRVIARASLQSAPDGRLQKVGDADQMEELLQLTPS